jgi:hypothetical protein
VRIFALYARTRGGPFDAYGPNRRGAGWWEYRVVAASLRRALQLALRDVWAPGPDRAGIRQIEWDGWNTCAACRAGRGCPEHLILAPYLAERAFV